MSGTATQAWQRHRHHVRQFVKFAVVGGSGVVVNMGVAIALHKAHGGTAFAQVPLFGIPFTGKSFRYVHLVWLAAFFVANVWNFQLNRVWTFRASRHGTWLRQFVPFLMVGSAAAVAGLLLISLFTHADSPLYLPEPWFHEQAGLRSRTYWAQLLTIVLTTPINFVANKLWTFRAVRLHVRDDDLPLVAPLLAADRVDETGHVDRQAVARGGPQR